MATQKPNNNGVYGLYNPTQIIAPQPIIAKRNPTSNDTAEFGTLWVNTTDNNCYIFTSKSTWSLIITDSTIDGDIIISTDGNIEILSYEGGIDIEAENNLALYSDSGDILIDSAEGSIDIGTQTGGEIVTIGNSLTGTIVSIQSGPSGALTIGTDASAQGIGIGNTTGASSLFMEAGAGNASILCAGGYIQLATTGSGNIGNINFVSNKVTAAAFSATNNSHVGIVTLTGQTLNQNATQVITITNSFATTAGGLLVTVSNLNASGNGGFLTVNGITQQSGAFQVSVTNNGGGNLTSADTIIISFIILA